MTNVLAIAGLVTVGLAVSCAVLLVVSFVAPGAPAVVITAIAVVAFAGLWFVLPLSRRDRDNQAGGDRDDQARAGPDHALSERDPSGVTGNFACFLTMGTCSGPGVKLRPAQLRPARRRPPRIR